MLPYFITALRAPFRRVLEVWWRSKALACTATVLLVPSLTNCLLWSQWLRFILNRTHSQGQFPVNFALFLWWQTCISSMTTLSGLYLYDNKFTGKVPGSWTKLKNLQILSLSNNNLNGTLPNDIGKLTKLAFLFMSSAGNFSSTIPAEIGLLSKLNYLYLGNISLTGPVPVNITSLHKLQYLDLSYNDLTGALISWWNLPNLLSLQVSFNNFTGNIPSVSVSPGLQNLVLTNTPLGGSIPSVYGLLPNLTGFNIAYTSTGNTIILCVLCPCYVIMLLPSELSSIFHCIGINFYVLYL